MSRQRLVVIGAAAASFIVLAGAFLVQSPPPKPGAMTRFVLHEARGAMERSESRLEHPLQRELLGLTNSLAINSKISSILQENSTIGQSLTNDQGVLVDGWDNPLNFAVQSELATSNASTLDFRPMTRSIWVWSSGPNRRNEFGHGDDVFLKE